MIDNINKTGANNEKKIRNITYYNIVSYFNVSSSHFYLYFYAETAVQIVIAGLEKVYNSKDKTIDDLCRDHYELSHLFRIIL